MGLQEAVEHLGHPRPRNGWMTMVGCITSPGGGPLIEVLDDAGTQLGHLPRHVQDHLASILDCSTRYVILPPPRTSQNASIPFPDHSRFSPVSAEIGHAVIVGVLAVGPDAPIQAVAVDDRVPASGLRLGHELSKGSLSSNRRVNLPLTPTAPGLPLVHDRHQG